MKIIGFAALCYAAITLWVYLSQRRLLYYPTHTIAATPAEAGLHHEDIWLTNRLGTRIHGWWLPHNNSRFTLLFAHGNGGNISHRLESFRIFHDLGLSIFIYDYSGYGQSHGEPTEAGMRADSRAAWDWLIREKKSAPQDILLFGRSLGGAVTAQLAGELAQENVSPAGIIMESTFTSVPDMGALLYPWLPVRLLASYQYNSVANLKPVQAPILFAHSRDDQTVPYALGLKLHTGYQGPKSFLELQGSHNDGFLTMGQAYATGLDQFIRELEGLRR